MIWNQMMERLLESIAVHPTVITVFGDQIRARGAGDQKVPGLEWELTGDTENELWEPMDIEIDLWTFDSVSNRRAERAIRALLHRDLTVTIDSIQFWTQYVSGTLARSPRRSGFTGRTLRFTVTPFRYRSSLPDESVQALFDTAPFEVDEADEAMWERVLKRVMAVITTDTVLTEVFGDHVRAAGTGTMHVPGIEWTLLGDTMNELWAPMLVQFDLWTLNAEVARDSEFRLRTLFHRELPVVIGADLQMWSQYEEAVNLATPDRSGFVGRAVRFRFTPLRQQYAFVIANIPEVPITSEGELWGSALFGEELFGVSLFN